MKGRIPFNRQVKSPSVTYSLEKLYSLIARKAGGVNAWRRRRFEIKIESDQLQYGR